MGTNISLCHVRIPGAEHPEWNCLRLAGDAELADFIQDLPSTKAEVADPNDPWEEDLFRPSDFTIWRLAETLYLEPHNPGRFKQLIDILEVDEEYAISISR